MQKQLARLRCHLRKAHASPTCSITMVPFVGLQEHIHECAECGTTILAQLLRIDDSFPYGPPIMGMSIEDQSRYLQ